jgi:TonB family protein
MLFVLVLFAASSPAQTTQRIVNGGVLNGKAISLPNPEYPESARSAGVSGMIGVNITIDESGTVIAAEAELHDQRERRDVDGTKLEALPADPMLRDAAEKAAWKAKFLPTRLNDVPIQIKGKVIYNFVARDQTANAIAPPPPPVPAMSGINAGVLNGKAISLPIPEYPVAAMAVKAGGAVSVQVLIDERGNVIQATAVSGHPLLRSAAETAARGARFAPASLSGNLIQVSGVVTYNFVP